MKTIVLDDDPTGTQSVTDATVLLASDADAIAEVLTTADAVYVQTNSRALSEADAVDFVTRVRADGLAAAQRLGEDVRFVLRGDSTLRGHVFAETEVFLESDSIIVFVPAFPEGGRTTSGGIHYVNVDGRNVPAHASEYAADPVFPFATGVLVDYVHEKSGRAAISVPITTVRAGNLLSVLHDATAGSVVVPDAETPEDIRAIADAVDLAIAGGKSIVVRSASPLAAELAGVPSSGLLATPLAHGVGAVLLVCGSHTAGATLQLDRVVEHFGAPAIVDTEHALQDPAAQGRAAAAEAAAALADRPLAFVTSARERAAEHNTLEHGEKVMSALTSAVRELLPSVSVVVSKGGITSAEVAATGIGATRAHVLGQILPGVSAWELEAHDGRRLLYIVVPGNVGGPTTLIDSLAAVGLTA